LQRKLNLKNIDTIEQEYLSSIEGIGSNIRKLEGIDLLTNIKRAKVGTGPYPDVSLFEAANRIMSDLVILRAINYLLYANILPFDEYIVEYGNEDNNQHDITSCKNDKRFAGEVVRTGVIGDIFI